MRTVTGRRGPGGGGAAGIAAGGGPLEDDDDIEVGIEVERKTNARPEA